MEKKEIYKSPALEVVKVSVERLLAASQLQQEPSIWEEWEDMSRRDLSTNDLW